jgi:hypothetical protein
MLHRNHIATPSQVTITNSAVSPHQFKFIPKELSIFYEQIQITISIKISFTAVNKFTLHEVSNHTHDPSIPAGNITFSLQPPVENGSTRLNRPRSKHQHRRTTGFAIPAHDPGSPKIAESCFQRARL